VFGALDWTTVNIELVAFVKLGYPGVVRVLSSIPELAGLILDGEHGALSDPDLETLTALTSLAGKLVVVRTPNASAETVARTLDRGATGVMLPRIRFPEEVDEALRGARYSPTGTRGFDPNVSAASYGVGADADGARIFVEIETREALAAASEIAAVDGVTDIFFGPADLARELGEPLGQIFTPRVVKAMEALPARAGNGRVVFGLFVDTPQRARQAYEAGYTFVAIGTDSLFLGRAAREMAVQMTMPA
jgi:2-keto-3-deoxy-L-rhamnonate aldolase RhmA